MEIDKMDVAPGCWMCGDEEEIISIMMNPNLEDTIILAANAHRGQVDKAGEPYICHPLRIMLSLSSHEERTVALLHDVVEDTNFSHADLEKAGYSREVLRAVELLTHDDSVDYFDYVREIRKNALARQVKLADLRDNMNLSRIPSPRPKDLARMEKYQKALALLETEES